jgi:hypothetical protein
MQSRGSLTRQGQALISELYSTQLIVLELELVLGTIHKLPPLRRGFTKGKY